LATRTFWPTPLEGLRLGLGQGAKRIDVVALEPLLDVDAVEQALWREVPAGPEEGEGGRAGEPEGIRLPDHGRPGLLGRRRLAVAAGPEAVDDGRLRRLEGLRVKTAGEERPVGRARAARRT
jgi:hypothetical protein